MMKRLKKILSVLTLVILIGSDLLTSFSYALDDILEDSEIVQTENEEETENVEIEEEKIDKEGIDYEELAENEEDEEMVAENDSTEELTGTEVDLGNDEDLGIDEETSEELTRTKLNLGDVKEDILSDKQEEELEGTGVELSKAWEILNDEIIEKSEQYNSVTVSVLAKEGTFPKGTYVAIDPIKSDYQLDEIREQINESDVSDDIPQNAEIVAFDIRFEYELSDGEKVELQPLLGESVQVMFDYSDNQIFKKADKNKNQEIEIYHINDKDENGEIVEKGEEVVEKIEINQDKSDKEDYALVIDAESFSIYVVTYGNENSEYTATLFGDDTARNNFHYKTITISDGTHTYTLMDRNLGARVAWDPEVNDFSYDNTGNYETESDYYGYYYQWGNSYGFSTNTTTINNKKGVIKLNAIPSNYVSSTWSNPWTPYYNEGYFPLELSYNLRGDTTNTESARQGPCPRGWHVPSAGEWGAIHNAWCVSAEKGEGCTASKEFAKALQMPTAGYRMYSSCLNPPCIKFYSCGNVGSYWSSTLNYLSYSPNLNGSSKANSLHFNWNNISSNNSLKETNLGLSVRCLKNNTDAVTLYLNPNSGSVENGIIDADSQGKVTLPTATRNEYNFDGWYDAADGGNRIGGSGDEITINKDTDLYAKWVIKCEDGEIYSPELGECVARWHELVSLTDDTTTTTVGLNDPVEGLPTTITVIENDILGSAEGDELSEIEGKELVGDITIDFGGDAIFSNLVQVKIPVTGSSKAYVKVKHTGSDVYNYDGLTKNVEASCDGGDIVNTDDMYDGEYMNVESGYVSIYTCEASNFAAIGLPKVTFEPENGSGATVVEVESGAMVNSGDIPTVTKDGYNFSGWYLTGAESAFDFSGTAITGDIILYARWQEGEGVTYTVTFDANRGTFADTPAAQTVTSGDYVEEPQTHPKLPGYTFTGWWTEPRDGIQWDFANDTVTGNITLYAKWEYNLTYGDLDVYMIDSSGSLIKYVMMDRNMGATGVYNKDFDHQNPNSFGFVYQWGNNYGFPRCNGNGACNYSPITETLVSIDILENYIPSKFASSTWIGKNGDKASTKSWHATGNTVRYLWGNGNTIDMQGPCPDGYHVPLANETNNEGGLFRVWGNIYDKTINTITGGKGSGFTFLSYDQELFSSQFLLPHAGAHKKGGTKEQDQNICGDYWTATPTDLEDARNMWFCKDGQNSFYKEHGNFLFTNVSQRNNGSTLRCFKNSTGSANLYIVNGGKKGLITVDKVGGVATINAIKEPENTDASGTDLIFGGWYTSQNFEPSTMKTGGDTLSDSVTALYAKWDCPDGLVYNSNQECVSGVLVRFMDGETEYTRSVVLSGEEVRAPVPNPEKAGYIFTGWFESGANLPFVFTGTPITGNLDLYAHWDINNNKYDVNVSVVTGDEDKGYLSGMGSTGISLTGLYNYGTELVFIAVPKLGYVFDYWMNGDQVLSGTDLGDGRNQLTVFVDQVLDIIAFFKETPTPYTVEHYQENLGQTGYDFVWSETMYGIANEQTNVTGTNYTGFILSGDLASYQTGINADGSTVVRLYYNRDVLYYTVTFENWNGDFLWSGKVASGETPTYNGSTPSRVSTEQSVYTFTGWYPELSPVTGDTTYTAIYTESTRLYTVTLTGTPTGFGTLSPNLLSKEYETAIVISGDQLTIGGTEVILTGNEGYEFQEWTGTCGFVERPICDEDIIYTHPGVIEFNGTNSLIITNPGYDLFSEANFHKDFEISFNILNLNLADSVNQATLISIKDEDYNNIWPGFTIRRGSATNYQITANGGTQKKVSIDRSAAGLNSLKIKRKNNILYISENGGEDIQIYNFTGYSSSYYFDNPIAIGSIYKSGAPDRYIKATLSDIVIKSIDTNSCHTGNVLAVTGDCQMTAVFSASNSHEVRIASSNTGYGTVSTESVTKPHGTPITDNGNGTLTIDDVTVTVTTGTAPAGYTYTFSGWTFSSECGSGGNYAVAEGCTITGNFEGILNTYTVTFDLSGGSLTGDMTLTKNYTIETPAISLSGYIPERNGYTFTGWYRDGTLVDSIAGGETGDYTLVARWEAQERPVPVVVFMKMLVPGEYTDYDSNLEWGWGTVGELYTAPIEQFTHTGFYYEEYNESNVRSVIVSPNVDNEVHLYFSRIPYPLIITNAGEGISYEATGGGDHLYEEPVTINITPYTGWNFLNWTIIQGTLSGVNDLTQRTLSFNMPAEQVRLSPNLNHIEYTLSFDSASGTAVANQTYYYDDLLSGLDNAITTRTGYEFSGWYLSGVLYTSGSTMPAENITLTAFWDINEYEVNASVATGDEDKGYLSGMGSAGISLTGLYDYATELVFIAIPELGYVFDYWKNGDTVLSGTDLGDGTNQLTVVVDQVLDIIAFFKPADDTPYTVEHYQANVELNGYDFVWSGIMYGTTNELTNATGTDYEGFSLHNGDISEYQTGIKADGSTVVRLYYDRNRYIVTWNTWNGHEVTKTDVAYGQHPYFYLTPPERDVLDPEDEDYDFTFTGWTRSGVSGIVDLETEIVTGDITYTAEYDRTLKYYTVKYYPNGGTGIMMDQTNLQLHTSGNLTKNNFTRTGYIFSGWYSSMGLRYEDEQEINMGRADGFEYDLSGNFFLSLEAQWEPKTDTKVTVNYYLKNLDVENNVLTGGSREYLIGVEFTGVTDDIVDIFAKYGTGIEGYEYSTSIVYGPDFPGGVETGTTTILADGSREIDMYYVPKKYNFTLNTAQYSSTAGSSESTGYYYGSKVTLSGASNDDCFTRSGWLTTGITLSDNTLNQTWFTMPANDVEVTPTVKENTYNIIFNRNESASGSMSPMNGVRCTESTGLTLNAFEKSGHTFTGWSTTSVGVKEYTDGQTVSELSKVDGDYVTLYAVWDINEYEIDANVATGDHGYLSGMGSVGISLTGLYDFGETLVVIAIPELGYLFDYWEVNGSQELPEGVTTSGNQLTAVVDQILDIVAHFKENVGTVTVNYYRMNTWGTYPGITNTTTFTGLVGYTGYATVNPPVGFHLDTTQTISTGIVISDNNVENVINIYYARNLYGVTLSYTGDFYGEEMTPGRVNLVCTTGHGYGRYYYEEHVHCEATANTGYIVKGWTYSGGNNVSINGGQIDFDMGTGEVHLTLDGDIINYYIYYYLDGGVENPNQPNNRIGYTVTDGSFPVYDPIKTGYVFLGWTGGINGTGISTPVSGLIINVASGVGNRRYYANWTGMEYVVTLYVEPETGGTVYGSGVYHYGDLINVWAMNNEGYDFSGWYAGYDKVSDYYSYGFQADDSGGTGLTAKFELKTYQVCIGSDYYRGSNYPSSGCYPYQHGSVVSMYAQPYEGYKVRNWMVNDYEWKTGDNQTYTGDSLDLTINLDTNVFINFEPIIYNITYMDGETILTGLYPSTYGIETSICDENYYDGGTCMYYLPTLTKDGYDFTGWYNTPRVSSYDRIKVLSGVGDKTIYAGRLLHDYNITYHLGSGESFSGEYYPYYYDNYYNIETPRTSLPDAQKSGYVFSGWVDDYGKLFTGYGGGMTGDLDLYPTWRPGVMDITVNYYEMSTGGVYYPSYGADYYTTYHYTGFTNSGFTTPDYSKTGFRLDWSIHPSGNPSIVISGNENANIIDVYYEREKYGMEVSRPTSRADMTITPIPGEYGPYEYYFGTEINVTIAEHTGYRFSGWNQEEGTEFPSDEVMDLTSRNITFHMPAHSMKVFPDMEHILYKLTFTGYEGAEVTNSDVAYDSLTGENYHRYNTELILPYLNKSGYNFLGWYSGESYVWSLYYYWGPNTYPTWNMPANDVELTAVFSGRTDMYYNRYYYLQDIEGTGYTLSGDLTDFEYDGITNQEIPGRYGQKYVTGFEYTGFGYSGEITNSWELRPYIKATGDNYVDYYYDRSVYSIDVNCEDSIESITGTGEYRYEAPVTLTITPKPGYIFIGFSNSQGGWCPDYDTGNSVTFSMPLGGASINAHAEPIEYSIEYELNGGDFHSNPYYPTSYSVEISQYIPDPEKIGYNFLGWTGGVIGERELTESTTGLVIPEGSIGDRKYFANWELKEENVIVNYYLKKIDAENNQLTGGVDVYLTGVIFTGLMDDVVNISGTYLKEIEGYHYDHATVYSGKDEITVTETTVLADGSREINMYYIPEKYNFTVIAGQNTSSSGTSISTGYYYGATVTLNGMSTDDCFGWNKWGSYGETALPSEVDETLAYTTFAMPAHNVNVEAMVSEKSYNIVFNGNGSTTGQMSTLSVQCTTGTLSSNNFERDGYTFTGWSRNSDGPVEFVGESDIHRLSTESGEIVNLYAIWDINHYTVTFDLNGGKLTGDMTLTTGYTIETPAISLVNYIPFKSGYIFTGWHKDDTLVTSIAGGETGDYTLTGRWEADNVVLHISYLGKMLNGEDYYIMSEGWDFPKVDSFYEAEIKDFTGFIYDPTEPRNITGRVVSWDGGQNDIQIYYKRIPYSLIITGAGEGMSYETTGSRDYLYEEPATISITPFTGWEFVNWTVIEGDLSGVNDFTQRTLSFNMPAEQVQISPNLNHIPYTVYFNSASGTAVESQTYYYDGVLSGLNSAITTRSGYSFSGWYLSGVLYTSSSKMPAENITLTAEWKAETGIQYQVNHRGENIEGTSYDVLLLNETKYGETDARTLANSGEFEGFTLSGEVEQKKINPSGTTVVNIYYSRNKYLITFKDGDGNVIQTGMVAYGDTPIYSGDAPTKTATAQYSYTFNDSRSPAIENVTTGATYTAQFDSTVNSYSATISSNNTDFGTVSPASVTGLYGSTIEVSSNVLTISGQNVVASPNEATAQYTYIFSGWNNSCGDEITGNCTITAEFTRTVNEYLITFVDGDGNTIQTGMVAYGETPEYTGATPTKTTTAQYTYTFSDTWSPSIEQVTTGATYTAQFNATVNEYLITFVDGDGKTIQTGMIAYGETPVYSGATPTKTATAQYTYTFNDTRSPAIEDVTTGATYTAQFSSIVNKYLITFVDGDGNTIQSGMVAYGETPEYTGATPTKTATAQYTYTFSDTWSPVIEDVTTGATYTAQFYATTNTYTATITSNNTGYGTVIPESVTGTYGDSIVISGNELSISGQNVVASPNDATAQYTYTFSGWNNTCGDEITGNCTITAEFTRTVNEYLITFVDGDGNTIQTGMVAYDETPEYTGATPTKTATAQYTYIFNDTWSPSIEQVTTGATYTAQFNSTTNKYLITFIDGDGNTIQTGMVAYGETPEYTGATPTKTATAQYTYTFNDTWSPAVEEVTTGVTYTAQFNATTNTYTATITSNNTGYGTVIPESVTGTYGDSIVISGNELSISGQNVVASPNDATAQYTYTFSGWNNTCGDEITGNCTITAEFTRTVNEYLITFVDGDGNTIQTGMVAYGETPVYSGATPTKTATAQYTYTFNYTWSPNIENVTTGATYTAQFESSINSYSVNIVSNSTNMGTISTGEINVEYGSNIVENGNKITIGGVEIEAIPNNADVQYTYEFDNWTNTCGLELVGTCTIQANFKKTLNKYTITWKDDDGNIIDTTMVEYGVVPTHTTPTKPETEDYKYTFAGWTPELKGVVGNTEYTAVFNAQKKEKHSEGGGMSGGGGRRSKINHSDNQHGSAEEKSDLFNGDNNANTGDINNLTLSLYQRARENNITTMNTLEEADPDGLLTRGHMAKMVVNFAQNVLGRTIPTTYPDSCNWKDKESQRESPEIKEYAKKACALGLMGIYVEEFMPNKILDRAEFGTTISRLLWGDKYNVIDTNHRSYYEDHLRLLKKNGILIQTNEAEDRLEIRKWVWLVFRRISEKFKK